MKKRSAQLILWIVLIVISISTLFVLLRNGAERTRRNIDYAFKEAIRKDYHDRLSYAIYYHSCPMSPEVRMYLAAPPLDKKIKGYTLKTRKGNTIYTFKDSLDEKTVKPWMGQGILSQVRPIKPNELNAIFRDILSKHDITGKTGVVCYLKKVSSYSSADSIVPLSAYCTPRYTLDITGGVKVQAWVDADFITIWKSADTTILWFFVELMIVAGLFILYRKRKKAHVRLEESSVFVQEGILIDLDKQELHIDGVSCGIQKLDLTLLHLFWGREGACVDREEIKQVFWPTDDNANEKIDAHIKMIRKILRDFPQYQLVTVRGKGYYLVCPNR